MNEPLEIQCPYCNCDIDTEAHNRDGFRKDECPHCTKHYFMCDSSPFMVNWYDVLQSAFDVSGDDIATMACTLTEDELMADFDQPIVPLPFQIETLYAWGENYVYHPYLPKDKVYPHILMGFYPKKPRERRKIFDTKGKGNKNYLWDQLIARSWFDGKTDEEISNILCKLKYSNEEIEEIILIVRDFLKMDEVPVKFDVGTNNDQAT